MWIESPSRRHSAGIFNSLNNLSCTELAWLKTQGVKTQDTGNYKTWKYKMCPVIWFVIFTSCILWAPIEFTTELALQLHVNVSLSRPLTARCVAHLVVHGTSGSTSYETTLPVPLETSGGALSIVDTVQRRNGPRNLVWDEMKVRIPSTGSLTLSMGHVLADLP